MKKNNLFILAFAACAALLSACSTELGTTDNPNHAGAGEAIVSVSLQFPQADKPAGYADAEPAVPTLDTEKEIKSIAFITFVKGQTGIFLSTNPPLSENGFTDPLTPVAGKVGEYTAKFKILALDFSEKETIVAVANFAEHGLTFSPEMTLDDLKKKLSDKLLDEADKNFIAYPLLMAVVKDELDITEGQGFNCDFEMTRIMARVDVVNKAYVEGTPQDGFVLTSARLISAPTEGTMIAGQTVTTPTYLDLKEETTVTDIAAVTGENPTPARQELASMYVYENSNKDKEDATKLSKTATYVEVKGTYKGTTYTKKIEFCTLKKVEGGVNVGGEVVPIVRNTRYLVQILPSESTTDPNFELAVKNWDDGEDLDVQVDFKVPVLEGLDQIPPNPSGATWDAATKTLNITNATAGTELKFMVRGFQDTDFSVEKEYDENVAPLAKAILVDPGTLTGYADAPVGEAPLVRTYKVTVPKAEGEFPSNTKIIVYNAAYPDAQTEINVKYAPVFVTDIKSTGATIDPVTRLVDLKPVAIGQTGEISFFTSYNAAFETTIAKKGLTNDFYNVTNPGVDEPDRAITKKYGPGKRVTLSYKELTNSPELAEVSVKETGADASTAKKLYIKCFKAPYFESVAFSPNAANTLVEGKNLYLAVNKGDHGTIDYTVYDDVVKNSFIPRASATYATTSTNSSWVENGIKNATVGDNLEVVSAEFQIVKRVIKVPLPKSIPNPASATNLKVGMLGEPGDIALTPVYPSAYDTADGTSGPITAADKAFRPVLVKTVWWAPINIGQAKIPALNDPSTAAGFLFQWGRKQALKWDSPKVLGPVDSAAAAGTDFITNSESPYDWLKVQNNGLWNSGTAVAPKKSINDPCPVGWRVPSVAECGSVTGTQTWAPGGASASANGLLTVTGEAGTNLLFPAAGRLVTTGAVNSQGTIGCYWASAQNGTDALYVLFTSVAVSAIGNNRSFGMSLRCVQDL